MNKFNIIVEYYLKINWLVHNQAIGFANLFVLSLLSFLAFVLSLGITQT